MRALSLFFLCVLGCQFGDLKYVTCERHRRSDNSFLASGEFSQTFELSELRDGYPLKGTNFKGFILPNGMQVILIHHPKWMLAAASLNVAAGHMNSPSQVPGLAHLVEHMLFTRNGNSTTPYSFSKYAGNNGGLFDAHTDLSCTQFNVFVQANALNGSLENLIHTVSSPIFQENYIAEESLIIDSEFVKNRNKVVSRLERVTHLTSDPSHPYSYFKTGNKDSIWDTPKKLGINVLQTLQEFYDKYYTSNLMTLVVVGPQSIGQLESKVVEVFSKVRNVGTQIPTWEPPQDGGGMRIELVPLGAMKELDLVFHLTEECWDTVLYYLVIFQHHGNNSLFETLRNKNYITDLSAERVQPFKGYKKFVVTMFLTPLGIECHDDIVQTFYEYVAMLKKVGPQRWFWAEMQQMLAIRTKWMDTPSPSGLVKSVIGDLQEVSIRDSIINAIFQNRSFFDFNPTILTATLDSIIPQNMRIFLTTPAQRGNTTLYDPLYDIHYNYLKIESFTIQKWANAVPNGVLELPVKNPFVPRDFQIKPKKDAKEERNLVNPFLVTVVSAREDITNTEDPGAYDTPRDAALNGILTHVIRLNTQGVSRPVMDLGMNLDVTGFMFGIEVNVDGFSDSADGIVTSILSTIATLDIKNEAFEIAKDLYRREKGDAAKTEPCGLAEASDSLAQTHWNVWDVLRTIGGREFPVEERQDVSLEDLKTFYARFMSRTWMEWLVYGNVLPDEAKELVFKCEGLFERISFIPLADRQYKEKEVEVPIGSEFVYHVRTDEPLATCTKVIFQAGGQSSLRDLLKAQILAELMWTPALSELRTERNLGYVVETASSPLTGTDSTYIEIVVQGERKPWEVQKAIHEFVKGFKAIITKLTPDEFNEKVRSSAKLYGSAFTDIFKKGEHFWEQIKSGEQLFTQRPLAKKILDSLSLQEIQDFFDELVGSSNGSRRTITTIVENVKNDGTTQQANAEPLNLWKRALQVKPRKAAS